MAGDKIGIVTCDFYKEISKQMIEEAKGQAKAMDVEVVKILSMPGAFDVPLAVKKILDQGEVEGVVTLGAVITGETDHDQVICYTVAKTLHEISLKYDKPVTLGISGPNQTREKAIKRIQKYARHSTEACIRMIRELK